MNYQTELITTLCVTRTCRKLIDYHPQLAYRTSSGDPICPSCIEVVINPRREKLGKMPIPILPNAYSKESFE